MKSGHHTLDIEAILNTLREPKDSNGVSYCEAILLRGTYHTFDSTLNGPNKKLLEYLGDQVVYWAEWKKYTQNQELKIVFSRGKNDPFHHIRYCQINTKDFFPFKEKANNGAVIKRLIQEASPLLKNTHVLELPMPTMNAHEKMHWMEKIPSLCDFEKYLDQKKDSYKKQSIWRIHKIHHLSCMIEHRSDPSNPHDPDGETISIRGIATTA